MKIPNWFFVTTAILALIGFVDATYLAVEHYLGLVPPCTVTSGCETVTTSAYSVVAGVPVALLGVVFYLIVLAAILWLWSSAKHEFFRYFAHFTWLGFLAAIYFTSIQAFVLKAYCQYCLLSALTSTIIFIVAQYVYYRTPRPFITPTT